MNDILGRLGYDDTGLGVEPQAITPVGAAETPSAALPTGSDTLDTAKVLARLRSPNATAGDKLMAGLGAKTGAAPSNKLAAVADGLFSGLQGAQSAQAAKDKASQESIKNRFGILKQLFDMDAKLGDQKQKAEQSRATIDATNRRTAAYENANKPKADDDAPDPAADGKKVEDMLAKHPSRLKLEADDEAAPSKRMSPGERAVLQEQYDADRKRLIGGYPSLKGYGERPGAGEVNGPPIPADLAPQQPAAKPAPEVAPPTGPVRQIPGATPGPKAPPAAVSQAAPASQAGGLGGILSALGLGGGGVTGGQQDLNGVPDTNGQVSPVQTVPNPLAQAAPAEAPKPDPTAIIGQAKAAIAAGKDPDAVRAKLTELGIDHSLLDE